MRSRPTAIVTVGAPGSGKSTYARQFQADVDIIERDIVRKDLGDGSKKAFYRIDFPETEQAVTAICDQQMRKAAKAGRSIIVSDTNTNEFTRHLLYRKSLDLGFKVRVIPFFVDLDVLLARNAERDPDDWVPEHVIGRMHQSMVKDHDTIMDEANCFDTNYEGLSKDDVVVFDIDGTLADMAGKRGPFDWGKVGLDVPRNNVVELCRFYMFNTPSYVVFFSGRDGSCFNDTLYWLKEYISTNIEAEDLHMRKAGDQRKDWIVKTELMKKFCHNTNKIPKLCIDDRQQVVDIWRNMGIEAWQVDSGKF